MAQNVINIRSLKKRFNGNEIIKRVNLNVYQGEIFGFLGRNGAGKSTLIHSLTGINIKSSGTFEILGYADSKVDKIKQNIGVMPDTSNLYQHMNALDFLMYMNELKGKRENKASIKKILQLVDLQNVGRKKIKSYSCGMKKKISIVQALLGNPKLVILDEPTSGLDPESSIKIQNLILELNKKGVTFFLTSHNLNEIEKICDRVAIMHEGEIKAVGTVRELKDSFKTKRKVEIKSDPALKYEDIEEWNIKNIKILQHTKKKVVLEISGEETIPDIIDVMVKKGYRIYGLQQEEVSLEDVFLAI